jgi:DNA-binding response OmpR family regulator
MTPLASQPAEILIVDADPYTLLGTAAVLDMAGYVCHCARDRQAALKGARTLGLDLVICDVHLGGESGLDVCRELRLIPGMQDVPVMFVSATQLPDIVRRSHEAGAAYYLRKPFDPDVLVELVGKALWLPHLVSSRLGQSDKRTPALAMPPRSETSFATQDFAHHSAQTPPVPAPAARLRSTLDAISGIRIPLA